MKTALGKISQLLIVVVIVSVATFGLASLMPGDPAVAILGEGQTPQAYAALRSQLGLDEPLPVRYAHWIGSVLHGDLGTSVIPPNVPVSHMVAGAFTVSLELAVLGLFLALALAVPLAMVSARRPDGILDRLISAGTFGILSVPSFVAGLVLIAIVVNKFQLFPRAEWVRLSDSVGGNLYHAVLPVITISLLEIPVFTRILRADLIRTLREEFVLASRAKGMPGWRIMIFDAFRPSSYSMITVIGLSLAQLIGSTVIVEVLFTLPGMGSMIVNAAGQGDIPVVQGAVLVIAVVYVLVNAGVDGAYSLIDPRIRRGRA